MGSDESSLYIFFNFFNFIGDLCLDLLQNNFNCVVIRPKMTLPGSNSFMLKFPHEDAPERRLRMPDVSYPHTPPPPLPKSHGCHFSDSLFLSPILFFCPVLLLFLSCNLFVVVIVACLFVII